MAGIEILMTFRLIDLRLFTNNKIKIVMKKFVPLFLFYWLSMTSLKAQVATPIFVKLITSETATKVKTDVVVFSNEGLLGFQFTFRWNGAAVKNPEVSSSLADFSTSSYSIKPNYINVAWVLNFTTPVNVNGTAIMSFTFDKINSSNPNFEISNDPVAIEFVGKNLQVLHTVILNRNDNPYSIKGKVMADLNQDCLVNTGDASLGNSVVKANNPVEGDFYGYVDTSGRYNIYVLKPNLAYTVSPVLKDSTVWSSCTKSIVTTPQADSLKSWDFSVQAKNSCIQSTVKVSIPFLRRCFSNGYRVSYQNTGTLPMPSAYIILTLDKDLTMESISLPYTALGNQQFRIELGNLPIGFNGSFSLFAKLNCDNTTLGQTHCVEAQIFPADDCYTIQDKIIIKGTCATDKVNFTLENQGVFNVENITYVIIEDDMIFKQVFVPNFSPGQKIPVQVPANGSVWRIEIRKNNVLIAAHFYEACGTNAQGKFSINYPMAYTLPEKGPNNSINCQQSIGAYDPNDKQGFPVGVKNAHYIEQNVPLEYLIRFQNTGTDTAFNVSVEDRIDDALLDLSQLRIISSSHKMKWSIKNRNVLVFDFKDIILADSFKNEKLSHGYVRFSIAQKRNNPLQSVIKNKAGIYFDFNPPVITNETFHTVGRDFLLSNQVVFVPNVSVILKPNPIQDEATMEVLGEKTDNLRLEIFDILGKKVLELNAADARFALNKSQFQTGMYVYRISQSGQLVANGKIIVE